MLKAVLGLFALVFFVQFLRYLFVSGREQKKEEQANAGITKKKSILDSFKRKHKEIDLDEKLVDEAEKLKERVEKLKERGRK
jgi:hypothetical protein